MQNLENILIPIVAISAVFSIPIIAIIYHFRQKGKEMEERKLMIEKGIVPPPLGKQERKRSSTRALQNGLNLLGVGLGLLVGFLVEDAFNLPRFFAIGGSILLFLGIANVLMVVLEPKIKDNNEG